MRSLIFVLAIASALAVAAGLYTGNYYVVAGGIGPWAFLFGPLALWSKHGASIGILSLMIGIFSCAGLIWVLVSLSDLNKINEQWNEAVQEEGES